MGKMTIKQAMTITATTNKQTDNTDDRNDNDKEKNCRQAANDKRSTHD